MPPLLAAPPKALIGWLPPEVEPKEPNEAGEKEAGEKAPLRPAAEPPAAAADMAAIGDMADMAPIGFEKDIPDMPDMLGNPPKLAAPKLSLFVLCSVILR